MKTHIIILLAVIAALMAAPMASSAAEFTIGRIIYRAPNIQDTPAVAYGGGVYLIAWKDKRGGSDYDIFCTRVDLNGKVLDKTGIVVSAAVRDQQNPAVAWNGSNFLVAWSDKRASDAVSHIYGARVTASGQVLDPQGFAISSLTSMQDSCAIASNGSTWFVVWQQSLTMNTGIMGVVVQANGTPGTIRQISSSVNNQFNPSVAWNGSRYTVVWQDYRNSLTTQEDIYGNQCDASGVPIFSEDILISSAPGSNIVGAPNAQTSPEIASDGSGFLVVWTDARAGSVRSIYGARLGSTGSLMDLGGIAIATGSQSQEYPAICRDTANYKVVWRSQAGASRTCKGTRVGSDGVVQDPNGFVVYSGSISATGPVIAAGPSNCYVAVTTLDLSNPDIYGSQILTNGIVPNPTGTLLSASYQNQTNFGIAWNGYIYVAVWTDKRFGSSDVFMSRITAGGYVLDPEGIALTTDTYDQTEPAIASNGDGFLVSWTDNINHWNYGLDIRGILLDRRGNIVGSAFNICSVTMDQISSSIAARGSDYLVAWRDWRRATGDQYYADLFCARVSPTGSVYSYSTPLSQGSNEQTNVKLTSDGTQWLAVWEDYRNTTAQIYAARVTNTSIVDVSGIRVSTAPAQYPCVMWSGTNYLVAWADYTNGILADIRGVRLNSNIQRLDASDIVISNATGVQDKPAIEWNGTNYVVAWEDYRNSVGNPDIYYTSINTDGVVLNPAGVQQTTSTLPDTTVKIDAMSADYGLFIFGRTSGNINTLYGSQVGLPINGAMIGSLKNLPDGSTVCVGDRIISAGNDMFQGFFYIQEPDRSSGIRVNSAIACQEGQRASVIGTLVTVNGERQIDASWVVIVP